MHGVSGSSHQTSGLPLTHGTVVKGRGASDNILAREQHLRDRGGGRAAVRRWFDATSLSDDAFPGSGRGVSALVTGTVMFDANTKTDGSLDYQASNGMWLHGVVTPGSYQKIDAHTAIFSGTITTASSDVYLTTNPNGAFFTAKVVDGGAPQDGHGDMIAVLNNQVVPGTWITSATDTAARAATIAYTMDAAHAGIVTNGNLTIN